MGITSRRQEGRDDMAGVAAQDMLGGADVARATAIAKLLGSGRFEQLLDILAARLEHIVDLVVGLPTGRAEIVAMIHQSQGSAGSLGLIGLMHALRQLESDVAENEESSADIGRRRLAAEVRKAIISLENSRLLLNDVAHPGP